MAATSADVKHDKALASIDASPRLRRELALRYPSFWDTYYCQMRWAAHRERLLNRLSTEFASARRTLAMRVPVKQRLVCILPRDHGKTEACCSFASQLIVHNRSIRILYVGESLTVAQKRVGKIKGILLSERVQRDWCCDPEEGYGPLLPPRGAEAVLRTKWGESIVQVLRPANLVDPTLEAVGIGGAITGGHFDVIIIDDPETYESVYSPNERRKRKEWLDATVLPMLAPGGLLVLVMTRKHYDDLAHHALDNASWGRHEEPAIKEPEDLNEIDARPIYENDEHGRRRLVGWNVSSEVEVLWPQERPIEFLLNERHAMGSTNFAREYQGQVLDPGTSPFKLEWLRAAKHRGRGLALYHGDVTRPEGGWPPNLLIVQGWDPAFTYLQEEAQKGDRSYAAGLTIAADVKTGDRYLMGLFRERGATPLAKARNVAREYRIWAPPSSAYDQAIPDYIANGWCFAVAMERNSAGELQRIDAQRAARVPIVSHWTGKQVHDPFSGVPGLAAQFETGSWVLPYAASDPEGRALVDLLVDELHQIGTARHDDLVKALWIAECLLRMALEALDDYLEAA